MNFNHYHWNKNNKHKQIINKPKQLMKRILNKTKIKDEMLENLIFQHFNTKSKT